MRFALGLVLLPLAWGCGDDPAPAPDGATEDADDELCAEDGECSDGLFCNGAETCDPESEDADQAGCVVGA